jgi:hypothetical protein
MGMRTLQKLSLDAGAGAGEENGKLQYVLEGEGH